MPLFTKDNLLISAENRKKRKGLPVISTMNLSEADRFSWRKRANQGDAFETEGAFRDKVFVPKTHSDIDPAGSGMRNRLRLEQMRRLIDYNRKLRPRNYIT